MAQTVPNASTWPVEAVADDPEEFTEEEISRSAGLLTLLNKGSKSISYCLWYLGYRAYSEIQDEDVEAGIAFYKEGLKNVGLDQLGMLSEEHIRQRVITQLEELSKKGNRKSSEQQEFWRLVFKLESLDLIVQSSWSGSFFTQLKITETGKIFVKKNQPYKIVSKLNSFFDNVGRYLVSNIIESVSEVAVDNAEIVNKSNWALTEAVAKLEKVAEMSKLQETPLELDKVVVKKYKVGPRDI